MIGFYLFAVAITNFKDLVLFLEEKSYIIKALFQKSKYNPRGRLVPGYDIIPVNNFHQKWTKEQHKQIHIVHHKNL
jgi:hypothetical protein